MFYNTTGKYIIGVSHKEIPWNYSNYVKNCKKNFEYDLNLNSGEYIFLSIANSLEWPFFVLAIRYNPCEGGFDPGIYLIEESERLFIGAGSTVLVFDIQSLTLITEEYFQEGFLRWKRYKDKVLMMAELDIACFDIYGKKIWERFIEPPYDIEFSEECVLVKMLDEEVSIKL